MSNEIGEANLKEVVPYFALSKNDSNVMSTSGGKIFLLNMMTFKTTTTFMAPPPAATSQAFHPHDNNVIAIGMDDSTIQIYNVHPVRVGEVKSKLKGHQKKVTVVFGAPTGGKSRPVNSCRSQVVELQILKPIPMFTFTKIRFT